MLLTRDFYQREDVVQIAKDLIGKVLVTNIDGKISSGIICETEAYSEREKGCHAYLGKKTARNEVMFGEGGFSYVYLCYGIHHLFNVVTNVSGCAEAVLIRGIVPLDGIEHVLLRRKKQQLLPNIGIGPGNMSVSLGIKTTHNTTDLLGDTIWIEDRAIEIDEGKLFCGSRIGIDYAGEDALLPWRFWVDINSWGYKNATIVSTK